MMERNWASHNWKHYNFDLMEIVDKYSVKFWANKYIYFNHHSLDITYEKYAWKKSSTFSKIWSFVGKLAQICSFMFAEWMNAGEIQGWL